MRYVWGLMAVAALALMACEQKPQAPLAERVAHAEAMTPADAALAEKFGRSCRACHVNPDSGAPLAGDVDAWTPRLAQSTEVLFQHVRAGYKAMPASGQCFDCTDDELKRLTAFMAKREGVK